MLNKLLICEYINKLRRDDLIKFCNIKGISASDSDLDIVYNYIKNDYKRFFNNPSEVLNEIKFKVSDNSYKIILELYNKYKRFI